MTWAGKAKEWGGGDFTFLSEDGETIIFVIVDEPQLIETKFKGKSQERIGCPIVTDGGFVLFVTGKRVFRRLAKHESKFKDTAFMVTRHGIRGDVDAVNTVTLLDDKEKTKQLFNLSKEYKPAMLQEALEAIKQVVEN